MSIKPITAPDPSIVQPLDRSQKVQQETQKVEQVQPKQTEEAQGLTEEQKKMVVDGFYSSNSMSTQDFMSLYAQSKDEPFEVLDKVIAKLKENVEAAGDAIEAISDMAEKTSKDNLALQVLQKTLEAMDENSGDR